MPCRPRVNLIGHPQHVVQRGHNREAGFLAEEDYRFYLHWLRESAKKYGCALHSEEYFLVCQRYIEHNPVRADMVADPGQYRWTSYRHYALGQTDTLVAPHPLYLALGRDEASRQAAYRALFRSQLDEEALADIRLAIAQDQPLGNDRFKEAVCAATGVRRAQARRGRPVGTGIGSGAREEQTDFGF